MQIEPRQNQIIGINMDAEIKKPFPMRPDFADTDKPSYDFRNVEDAGKYRGVGERGKTGAKEPKSTETMPDDPMKRQVKGRDDR